MFLLKTTFISFLICFVSSDLITKDFETTFVVTDKNNIVSLDIIDDSTIDIHYKSTSEDFKCFVDWHLSIFESITEKSFSKNIVTSFVTKDKIHLLHHGESEDFYVSLFSITAEGDLKEISREKENDNYQELKSLIYNPIEDRYVGFSDESIVIFKKDDQGKFQQENKLAFSGNDEEFQGQIYNAAYSDGFLYLAKGELGVQVVNMKDDKRKRISLSPSDLELNERDTVIKVEVPGNQILYAYCTNLEENFVLILDFSDLDEIKILNRYSLEVKNVIEIFGMKRQIAVFGNNENKYYFKLFSTSQDQHNTINLVVDWEIPFEITHVRRNEGIILIEGKDYFYILKDFHLFEGKKLELALTVLEKESQESIIPIFQGNNQYLLSLNENKIALLEVPQTKLSYKCGVFKRDYQGVFPISLYVYKNSCPEATSDDTDNMCLYRYNYTLNFTGEEYTNIESNFLLPHELRVHNEKDEEIFNYYSSPHPRFNYSQNPDIPDTHNEDDTPETNPNEHNGHGSPKNNPSSPNQQHGHGHGMKSKPVLPQIPTKEQLDEMDRQRTFYGKYKNYILGVFVLGLLIVTGCIFKCMFNFARSKLAEFKHEELQEIESDDTEDIVS